MVLDGGSPSAPLVHGDIVARIVAEIDLPRTGDFLLGVEQHLLPLRDPAGSARNRKEYREHGDREAHGLVNQAGVEVHVRIKLALDEVFVFESDAFALERDFQQADSCPSVRKLRKPLS